MAREDIYRNMNRSPLRAIPMSLGLPILLRSVYTSAPPLMRSDLCLQEFHHSLSDPLYWMQQHAREAQSLGRIAAL